VRQTAGGESERAGGQAGGRRVICCFIGNALPVVGVGVLSSLIDSIVAEIAFA